MLCKDEMVLNKSLSKRTFQNKKCEMLKFIIFCLFLYLSQTYCP